MKRLACKKIYLHYKNIDIFIKKESLLAFFNGILKGKIKNYIIGFNLYSNNYYSIHILFLLESRCDIRKENTLILNFDGRSYSGEYLPAKNIDFYKHICTKGKDFITNFEIEDLDKKP
jgi:hypothetical protein